MRVLAGTNYVIYVYPEDHAPPHCHIRYSDDGIESLVDLYFFEVIGGRLITRKIRAHLFSNQEILIRSWERLNPRQQDQTKSKKSTKE